MFQSLIFRGVSGFASRFAPSYEFIQIFSDTPWIYPPIQDAIVSTRNITFLNPGTPICFNLHLPRLHPGRGGGGVDERYMLLTWIDRVFTSQDFMTIRLLSKDLTGLRMDIDDVCALLHCLRNREGWNTRVRRFSQLSFLFQTPPPAGLKLTFWTQISRGLLQMIFLCKMGWFSASKSGFFGEWLCMILFGRELSQCESR